MQRKNLRRHVFRAVRTDGLLISCHSGRLTLLYGEFRYAITAVSEVDDAHLHRLPDSHLGWIRIDDRIDPQSRLLNQFDEPDDVRGHPAGNERLADHNVAEDRAVATDFLEVYGATGVAAAFQRRVDPLAGIVAAAQHQLADLQTLPVRRRIGVGYWNRRRQCRIRHGCSLL